MLIVAWLAAANLAIWSQAFKQYRWANHVHFYCMSIVTILTWMSCFMMIIEFGTNNEAGNFHTGLGIAIMAVVALQSIGGLISWTLQK